MRAVGLVGFARSWAAIQRRPIKSCAHRQSTRGAGHPPADAVAAAPSPAHSRRDGEPTRVQAKLRAAPAGATMRGLSMGASMLDKLKDAGMTRKSKAVPWERGVVGGERELRFAGRLMGRSSQRSSSGAEIVLKKWTAPEGSS